VSAGGGGGAGEGAIMLAFEDGAVEGILSGCKRRVHLIREDGWALKCQGSLQIKVCGAPPGQCSRVSPGCSSAQPSLSTLQVFLSRMVGDVVPNAEILVLGSHNWFT
jgi:hypothetical protein